VVVMLDGSVLYDAWLREGGRRGQVLAVVQ
jgi:hypothetical protein